MIITNRQFGHTKEGKAVTLLTMKNSRGMEVEVLDYGCTIRAIRIPGKNGSVTDVCLGYDTVAEYEENPGYLGAVIGRHGNRIAAGRFALSGKEYTLACNDGPNHLHGGVRGFDKWVWEYRLEEDGIHFLRTSPDGEEGYPGNLRVEVVYTLTEENELVFRYDAVSDADTALNMTNHTYFNLGGQESGPILGHLLRLNAAGFAENDTHCLPTGKTMDVAGSPFDFRAEKPIGRDLGIDCAQIHAGQGYDHNYVLEGDGPMREAGSLCCPDTGIRMTITTTKPCIQLYTGNVLGAVKGKGGVTYGKRHALCLETQFYPNSLACGITPSAMLKKGERYLHTTTYRFEREK